MGENLLKEKSIEKRGISRLIFEDDHVGVQVHEIVPDGDEASQRTRIDHSGHELIGLKADIIAIASGKNAGRNVRRLKVSQRFLSFAGLQTIGKIAVILHHRHSYKILSLPNKSYTDTDSRGAGSGGTS